MIIPILITNLYWLSFCVVGAAVFIRFGQAYVKRLDIFTLTFVSFLIGASVFLPFIFPAYLLNLPVAYLSLAWGAIVLIAFSWMVFNYRLVLRLFEISVRTVFIEKSSRWLAIIFMLLLIFDFALSIIVGGTLSLGNDTWVHLARVNDMLSNGATINDPFFPQHIDSRYHLSLVHLMYASGSWLTNTAPVLFWKFSLGIFKALAYLGIYIISFFITKSRKLALLASIPAVCLLAYDLYYFLYPNNITLLWYVGFIISLVLYLSNPLDKFFVISLVASTALVSFSHPGYSAYLIPVTVLSLIILKFIYKSTKLTNYRFLLLVIFLATITPTISYLQPNNMSEAAYNYGIDNYQFASVLGLTILNPLRDYYSLTSAVGLTAILWFVIKHRGLYLTAVTLSVVFLYIIVAYNPFIFEFLADRFPVWFIRRLRFTNYLNYVMVPLGLLLLGYFLINLNAKTRSVFSRRGGMLYLIPILLIVFNVSNFKKFYDSRIRNDYGGEYALAIKDALPDFKEKTLVVAEEKISYIIPSVVNAEVINIETTHAAPATVYPIRKACLEQLLSQDDSERQSAILALRPEYYLLMSNQLSKFQDKEEFIYYNQVQRKAGGFSALRIDYGTLGSYDTGGSHECKLIKQGKA